MWSCSTCCAARLASGTTSTSAPTRRPGNAWPHRGKRKPAPDHSLVEKVARHFDGEGRLLRWPSKAPHLKLCLWVLWSRIPSDRVLTEREINELLNLWHVFGDHAVLRRALFEAGLVDRTQDGRRYRRIEQKPPVELSALLARVTPVAA